MRKSKRLLEKVTVKVPATTSNLGPGFDVIGMAVGLWNRVSICRGGRLEGRIAPMASKAGEAFFQTAGRAPFSFSAEVVGDVPVARGLGSSVTVRGGVVAGLNALCGHPLSMAECMGIVTDLEGHPDNAVPAFMGGFVVCAESSIFRTDVASRMRAVVVLPSFELDTDSARRVLPKTMPLQDVVYNLREASLIAAAFASKRYELLRGGFGDRLHQPARRRLLPMLDEVIAAGTQAGALGAFLSGSGSAIMALCLSEAEGAKVSKAMLACARRSDPDAQVMLLKMDNRGMAAAFPA